MSVNKFDTLRDEINKFEIFIEDIKFKELGENTDTEYVNNLDSVALNYHKKLLLNFLNKIEKDSVRSKWSFEKLLTHIKENYYFVLVEDLFENKITMDQWLDIMQKHNMPIHEKRSPANLLNFNHLASDNLQGLFKCCERDFTYLYNSKTPSISWSMDMQIGLMNEIVKHLLNQYLTKFTEDILTTELAGDEFKSFINKFNGYYKPTQPFQKKIFKETYLTLIDCLNILVKDNKESSDLILKDNHNVFNVLYSLNSKFSQDPRFLNIIKKVLNNCDNYDFDRFTYKMKAILTNGKFQSFQNSIIDIISKKAGDELFSEENRILYTKVIHYNKKNEIVLFPQSSDYTLLLKNNKSNLFYIKEDIFDTNKKSLFIQTHYELALTASEVIEFINAQADFSFDTYHETESDFAIKLFALNSQKVREINLTNELKEIDKANNEKIKSSSKPKI